MNFGIHPELKPYLPQPSDEERAGLKKQIEQGKHLDAGVVFVIGEQRYLGDGHTRLEICKELGLDLPVRDVVVEDLDEAKHWIRLNQMNRRNLTPERLAFYIGEEANYQSRRKTESRNDGDSNDLGHMRQFVLSESKETLAEKAGVSTKTVNRDAKFADAVNLIEKTEGVEAKEAILSGKSGKTKAEIIATLPAQCPRCKRVGNDPLSQTCQDCAKCAEARKKAEAKAARKKSGKKGSKKKKTDKSLAEEIAEVDAAEQEPKEQTIEEIISEKNSAIESFCRSLMKFVEDNTPDDDPWLHDNNRRAWAIQKIKDACGTLRTCKCHAPCPHKDCGPGGCEYCLHTGRVTKYKYDMMV